GRLRTDAHRCHRTASQDLVHEDVVNEGDPGPARFLWEMECPIAERLRAALHVPDDGRVCRPTGLELPAACHAFQRVDVLVHEAAHANAQALDLLGNGEVHRLPPY